jgi:opacity protein-like surface antigen
VHPSKLFSTFWSHYESLQRQWAHSSIIWYTTLAILLLWIPGGISAQGVELSGGWVHVTQDFGTDGFNVGLAVKFHEIAIAGDYDMAWDTSSLSLLNFNTPGSTVVKSRLQNVLFGPRYFFVRDKFKNLVPFAEAEFGVTHLHQDLDRTISGSQSGGDSAFSWMLGGGLEYRLAHGWAGRFRLDYLRSHLADLAQSRARIVLGIAYTFGAQ